MKLTKAQLFSILDNSKDYDTNNIQASCPWCQHKDREFYVSLKDNHLFQCLRKKNCGETGNIYKLLKKLNRFDLANFKENVSNVSVLQELHQNSFSEEIDINLSECKLPIGFKRIYNDEYLASRGFKNNDFNDYVIGYSRVDSKLQNYVVFVIVQDYKQVAWMGRFKASKKEIKALELKSKRKIVRYKNSFGTDFSKILGGHDELIENVTKTVILVEGLFDKKNIDDKLGLKNNDELKCCFTFKCHVSKEQIFRLKQKGVENCILLYDSDVLDKVKEQAIELITNFHTRVGFIEFLNDEGEIKDPGELNYDEVVHVINNLQDPFKFYTSKLKLLDI